MNAIFFLSSRGAERRGDLILFDEMATLPSVACHDNVIITTSIKRQTINSRLEMRSTVCFLSLHNSGNNDVYT